MFNHRKVCLKDATWEGLKVIDREDDQKPSQISFEQGQIGLLRDFINIFIV